MENYYFIIEGENPKKILLAFTQPLTSAQLSRKTGIPLDTIKQNIIKLSLAGLVLCLSQKQRNNRVYRLTNRGIQVRNEVCRNMSQTFKEYYQPSIDWDVYAGLCFCHRTAVIKTLTKPMQPSQIKRVFRMRGHNLRINSNNIRDIIRFLLANGIVRAVKVRGKAYLRYELTDLGNQFRQLLTQAEMPTSQNNENIHNFENEKTEFENNE